LAVARLRGWNRGITSTRCVRLALTLTTYRCVCASRAQMPGETLPAKRGEGRLGRW
jgi:hypothetical protein